MCDAVVVPDVTTWRCSCGGPFSLDGSPPLPEAVRRLSLGEGSTPVVDVRVAGRTVAAKVEFASPTLSFKDRGAVVLVAAALELGAEHLVADSSGNAGTAIAAYAARAALPCEVFVAAATSPGKLAHLRAVGAIVRSVDGSREDVAAAALERVDRGDAFYASHVWNPWFFEGTKQFVLEAYSQLRGQLPDTLVLPAGNGTLVLGAWRALQEIDWLPRIVAVQAAACAPVAKAFVAGALDVAPVRNEGTIAEGIAIAAPVRGREILAAVRATDGSVVTVADEEVLEAQAELATQGLYVEPTAAAPAAAVRQLDSGSSVLLPLSGAGAKVPPHG